VATALYRRYRPETFAEVIGQEHVTDPLRAALRAGRVNHAYLFSGPRGCGKTTSARILARCLNCAQGPTDTPCGVCDSCVELARGGSGSLDVVEIDAASHGGVDDARELRERATFAPARDQFKIFIIDEAHMVSPQGFNALLKIVEEPPEHIKFVFATTEPDKVLGTIRSRTHHYPFHLVPPERLQAYLQQVCDAEGVPVGKGVLPLVVRAGAGSVRDSLSVLDQLAAGAGPEGIDYERAIALLGYTHATLLDDVVSAFGAGDGATVFRVVDRVVSSGQDPRRFVEDLLQRLRDLVIVQAVGERSRDVFPGCPEDQLERMHAQAAAFGAAQLSRAADLANAASTEMTGATSPRLHLELLCARMLLPAAEDGERGLAARLDRLERRLSVPVPGASAAPASAPPAPPVASPVPAAAASAPPQRRPAAAAEQPVPQPQPQPEAAPQRPPAPSREPASRADSGAGASTSSSVTASGGSAASPGSPDGPSAADSTEAVRRMWPDVLDHLATVKRRTWTRVSQDAQVLTVDERQVVLQFQRPNTMAAFTAGPHADFVRESLIAVLGLDRVVVAVAGPSGQAPAGAPAGGDRQPSAAPAAAPAPVREAPARPVDARRSAPQSPPWDVPAPQRAAEPDLPPEPPDDLEPPPPDEEPVMSGADLARSAARAPVRGAGPVASAPVVEDEPSRDDPDAEDSGLVGAAVVEQRLGGRIIAIDERS
jgi:DNA polymerase III subunit gamma/tau